MASRVLLKKPYIDLVALCLGAEQYGVSARVRKELRSHRAAGFRYT